MKSPQRALAALVLAGAMVPATSAARIPAAPRPTCAQRYTLGQFDEAARAVYREPLPVPRGTYGRLWRLVRCQRRPWNVPRARAFWRAQIEGRGLRRHPFSVATVSWYDDAGTTASGYHAYYGFATCGSGGGPCLAFGTRVEFCFPPSSARCVIATADDHGPFIAGRAFDLNQNTAAAIGFGGVAPVSGRVVG